MDANGRDLFRVNVSRGSGADSSLTASIAAPSTPRGASATPLSTPAGGGAPAHHQHSQQQQQQRISMRTPLGSPPLSLRGDSPSIVLSHPASPPRVRPTDELPPTRDANNVMHSAPTVVKEEESLYHLPTSQSSPSAIRSPVPVALPTFVNSVSSGFSVARAPTTVFTPTAKADKEEIPMRTTTCRVCSLCGTAVLLVGTLVEHQQQWKEHVGSWVHQRNLQLRSAAENCGARAPARAVAMTSPPLSPTVLKALEEITASPVAAGTDNTSAESVLFPHSAPEVAEMLEAQRKSHKSLSQNTMRHTASPPDAVKNMYKGLFLEGSRHGSSSGDEDEKETPSWARTGEPTAQAGRWQEKVMLQEEPHRQRHVSLQRVHTNNMGTASRTRNHQQDSGDGSSSTDSALESLIQRREQKKERQLERTLTRFMVKKERQQLLVLLRRWYNIMFLRVLHNSSSRKEAATVPTVADPSAAKQMDVKESEGCTPSSAAAAIEGSDDASVPAVAPQPTPAEARPNRSKNRKPHEKRTTGASEHGAPFMASRVKDFAHLVGSSFSSSVEMEVAKTDVSWFIHRTTPNHQREDVEDKRSGGAYACSLGSDSSIEEMISSLAQPSQERVRAALQGEPLRSCAFPKTSEALGFLRSSVTTASYWPSGFVGGSCGSSASYPMAHVMQSVLEETGHEGQERHPSVASTTVKRNTTEETSTDACAPQETYTATLTREAEEQPLSRATDVAAEMVQQQQRQQKQQHSQEPTTIETVTTTTTTIADAAQHASSYAERSVGRTANDTNSCEDPSQTVRHLDQEGLLKESQLTPADDHSPSPPLEHDAGDCDVVGSPDTDGYQGYATNVPSSSSPPHRAAECDGSSPPPPPLHTRRGRWTRDTTENAFRGVPGEYYCYYDGAYHHVRDPTSDMYCDAWGQRLPMYIVRRGESPARSPTRRNWRPTTRPRSPLGPSRLNPYCDVCVARYNLVWVGEDMQPVAPTPARKRRTASETERGSACVCSSTRAQSLSSSPRRLRRPDPLVFAHPPHRGLSDGLRKGRRRSAAAAVHQQDEVQEQQQQEQHARGLQRDLPDEGDTQRDGRTADTLSGATELHNTNGAWSSNDGVRGVMHDVSPEGEAWLRRQERRVRRRMKLLLWHDLPESRGSHQWVEYLTSLKEATQMLEALRRGRTSRGTS
ncbi:megakaryocyte stimulating factor [Trypanosoma grayi]|uniref:megakaryocyte stimulating factor n=1 Tax=Trypanosoma grayi TaxID=71804 RepID=UPI0004F42ACE|nr:megakaryocyte stimulating factor [Trypanosoma grayi]KEG14917.1 megakaryocyte stimulating factor [Trypanosoma grayi]